MVAQPEPVDDGALSVDGYFSRSGHELLIVTTANSSPRASYGSSGSPPYVGAIPW